MGVREKTWDSDHRTDGDMIKDVLPYTAGVLTGWS